MTNQNVLLKCDASYTIENQMATLGVYDEYENKKYGTVLYNVNSNTTAELCAMIYAVTIAKKKRYRFVIIANDCRGINTMNLYHVAKPYFQEIQFLWIRRTENVIADAIATKMKKQAQKKVVFSKSQYRSIITIFSSYSTKHIITAAKQVASPREYKLLDEYLLKDAYCLSKTTVLPTDLKLYKFIYAILHKEEKRKFFMYLKRIYPLLKIKKIAERPTNKIIIGIISQILYTIKQDQLQRSLNEEKITTSGLILGE